jgi:hypothetical protein
VERGRTPADRGEPMLTWPLGLHARPTVELPCSLCHGPSRPTIAMGRVVGWPSSPWHGPLNVSCPASRPECPAIVVRNAVLCAGRACLCLIKVTLPPYSLCCPLHCFFPCHLIYARLITPLVYSFASPNNPWKLHLFI